MDAPLASILVTCSSHSLLLYTHSSIGWIPKDSLICLLLILSIFVLPTIFISTFISFASNICLAFLCFTWLRWIHQNSTEAGLGLAGVHHWTQTRQRHIKLIFGCRPGGRLTGALSYSTHEKWKLFSPSLAGVDVPSLALPSAFVNTKKQTHFQSSFFSKLFNNISQVFDLSVGFCTISQSWTRVPEFNV